jgi:epoxide hydrolase-like predicted phosphatase
VSDGTSRLPIAAVIFDLGGVVLESPLEAIARYERDHGLAPGSIMRAVATGGDQGAWSRLERGELTVRTFCAPFEADCRLHGLEISAEALMEAISQAVVPRPMMLEAIRRLRQHRLPVAALTNNWITDGPAAWDPLRAQFDLFVESCVVRMRKPDPRIYELVSRELGIEPRRTVFLDDIGANLKAARALGMITIKVDRPDRALRELGALVGLELV